MGFWSSLLKTGGKAAGATGKAVGGAVLHPSQTLRGAGSALKTATVGAAAGYVGWEKLTTYVSSMKYIFTKEGAQSVGGFGAIGNMFPAQWNWYTFWYFTAFLSVILAFMNILPIPALDGGHVVFTLWEIVTRRKPSIKVLEYSQMIGMAFLLLLLVYANGNDIYKFFFK